MILQRCRRAESAHNCRRVIREAAFGGIGGAEIEQASAAGFVALQRFSQTVGFKVPVRARGEHQMSYIRFAGYRMMPLSFSITGASQSTRLLDRRLGRSDLHSNRLPQTILSGSSFLGLAQAVSKLLGR